jgi:hypothetical protein
MPTHRGLDDRPAAAASGRLGAFIKDCALSAAFIAEPGNVIIFLVMGGMSAVLPILGYAGCIGFLGALIVNGWVASFLFNVLLNAANGEKELPEMSMTDGLVDTVIVPLFKFVAAWAIAFAPCVVYSVNTGIDYTNPDAIWILLAVGGAAMFPMTVLILAVCGVSGFSRPDLIVMTVARTALPYGLTVVLVSGALVAAFMIKIGVLAAGSGQHLLATMCVFEIVGLYGYVVAMRVVGLYYHHFKSRFAWSWG